MSASAPIQKTLLRLFAEAKGQNLSTTNIKKKLASASKKSPEADADAIDQALTSLIDDGHLTVTGAAKTGHHPRAKGSYRLTSAGKDHTKPGKPDASADIIAYQEAYILLQFLRVKQDKDASMTRSELNGKLKTKSAKESAEFDPKNKEIIDYHVYNLVRNECLEEQRKGASTRYTLTDEGRKALGAANQHETVSFTFTGAALNTLLQAARDSSTKPQPEADHTPVEKVETAHHAPAKSPTIKPKQIHEFIAHLKADKYAGRDLIPIHEVRTLVAHHHGPEAASHPVFDPMLKRMRSEGELEIIAIADSRDTPQQHLDDSIPGMNETLFFIDTE